METGTLAIWSAVVLLVVIAVILWRRGEPVTLEGIVSAGDEAAPLSAVLVDVAGIGVQAAEQLFATGRITRGDRLTYAMNYVKSWSPALAGLENEKVLAAIESAVLVANALRAQGDKVTTPKLP
jgi:hypothetical protein